MATWVRCTHQSGNPLFVNLSTAMSAYWNENEKYTVIAYAGDDDDDNVLHVREKPEAILAAGNIDFDTA